MYAHSLIRSLHNQCDGEGDDCVRVERCFVKAKRVVWKCGSLHVVVDRMCVLNPINLC